MGWDARMARLWIALVLAFAAAPAYADENTEPGRPALKEWTILVFLNGHNDLDSYGAMNVNAMERVGSSPGVNIVVQWASLDFSTTKRILVQKDNDEANVTSPMEHDPGHGRLPQPRELCPLGERKLSREALLHRCVEPRLRLA